MTTPYTLAMDHLAAIIEDALHDLCTYVEEYKQWHKALGRWTTANFDARMQRLHEHQAATAAGAQIRRAAYAERARFLAIGPRRSGL